MRHALWCLGILSLAVASSPSVALEVTVSQDGGGDYTSIQVAIDAVEPGDIVTVYPGTYRGQIDFLGKDITVRSSAGAASTAITNPLGSCATFHSGETAAAALIGFTLRDGTGTLHNDTRRGGAIFCLRSSPRIEGCVFERNFAHYAAAIYVELCDSVILDCRFIGNTCIMDGGAIAGPSSRVEIYGCYFEQNTSLDGYGTIHLGADSPIEDCVFVNNQAMAGGAISTAGIGADYSIRRCTFIDNDATSDGGAIRVHRAQPTIEDCLFVDNSATYDGGAILCINSSAPVIRHCTFDHNDAGRNGGNLTFLSFSVPTLENCIVAGAVRNGGLYCADGARAAMGCNDFWMNARGNYGGDCPDVTGIDGNIAEDPLWCGPPNDYGIASTSACAPAHSEGCDLIGAFDVACTPPVPVEEQSWGGVKAKFRFGRVGSAGAGR
ncbi:MAG: hypothetical protein KC729_17560 [Candidatus Eisenbacteria bacterium]|uniref:Right handed beta helix domain-containing protein n=1 Tax=Eiseniibacteriota bacterium TaxID=2212470 RepID=A0A956M288_UNCEI|nr:hypothetical protein [Candidatus Eisenbacteria bacterium]